MLKKLTFFCFLGLMFAYCGRTCGGDKTAFIKNFSQFVDEKTDKSANDARDRLFRQYIKECYPLHETQMGISEKKDFWLEVLRYYYQRYGLNMITELGKEKDFNEILIKGLKEIGVDLDNIKIADLIRLI